jgi:hypothetical protein
VRGYDVRGAQRNEMLTAARMFHLEQIGKITVVSLRLLVRCIQRFTLRLQIITQLQPTLAPFHLRRARGVGPHPSFCKSCARVEGCGCSGGRVREEHGSNGACCIGSGFAPRVALEAGHERTDGGLESGHVLEMFAMKDEELRAK